MRIRPSLRLARAAAVCALAVGLGTAPKAWSQSLIEALGDRHLTRLDPGTTAGRRQQRQHVAVIGERDQALVHAARSHGRPELFGRFGLEMDARGLRQGDDSVA